jgi:N-glycosylase/DNA lyase
MTNELISNDDLLQIRKILDRFKRHKSDFEIFYDLCFCISVPQDSFKKTKKVIAKLIDKNFFTEDISLFQFNDITKSLRFHTRKSKYLLKAKEDFPSVLEMLNEDALDVQRREWLVKNIYGLGMKTASHFLRNQGIETLAIIDTHILKFLESEQPKNEKDYLRLEKLFINRAAGLNVSPAELDAFVWKKYSNTSWEEFVF